MEDSKITMNAGERFISIDGTTGMSVNLCVKCADRKKVGLCPCKLYIDTETKLLDAGVPIDIKAGIEKGGREVDVIEAQGMFEKLKREKEPMRHMRSEKCPQNCRARAINLKNDGGCTPENCIKLPHKAKALAAVSLATGINEKPKKRRLRKYDRRDIKLLVDVTSFNKITSGPKYRFVERGIIKQQFKELGLKLPPMRTGERSRVAKGLQPLPTRHLSVGEITRAREQLKKIAVKDTHVWKNLPPRRGLPPQEVMVRRSLKTPSMRPSDERRLGISKKTESSRLGKKYAKITGEKEPLKPLPPRLGVSQTKAQLPPWNFVGPDGKLKTFNDMLTKEEHDKLVKLKYGGGGKYQKEAVVRKALHRMDKAKKENSGTLEEWGNVILKDIPKERLVSLGGEHLPKLTKSAFMKRLKEEIEKRKPFVVGPVDLERIKLEIQSSEFEPVLTDPKWILETGYDLLKKPKQTKTRAKKTASFGRGKSKKVKKSGRKKEKPLHR